MCSMSVLCPLCAQTSFTSIDALRNSLIKAANGPLACPICNDLFLGLDKLTIHLFSHTNFMTHNSTSITTTTTNDVPKNLNEIKATTNTSKSPNIDDVENENLSLKKTAEENIVSVEKKPKRCKQTKATTKQKCKEIQQEIFAPSTPKASSSTQFSADSTHLSKLSACDICEFTFRNEQLRDMHFRLVHQNSPKVTTIPSNEASSIRTTTTTKKASNEADFKCHICAKTFKMKGSLRVHLKVVHMIGISQASNSSKLGICDRIRCKDVKNHQQNINSTAAQALIPPILVPESQTFQNPMHIKNSPNSPNSPELQLGTLTLLPAQQINEIGSIENQEEKSKPIEELTVVPDNALLSSNVVLIYTSQNGESANKTVQDNPKIWECDVCSKSFTTKYFLKKHKRLHTGEMPYSCEICARTFTFQQSYHKHLLYHSDEKPHICAVCGRAFKELSTLHNHERIHSGEKPFKCEICGKCFRQRVSFLVHTRIHTGVMPYKCEQCEKNFRYKVSLRTHKCLSTSTIIQPQLDIKTNNSQQQLIANNQLTENSNDPSTENFIKAFLESNVNKTQGSVIENESQNSPASLEIALITDSTCIDPEKISPKSVEALLSKTIDDIVVESCNKMGIGVNSTNLLRPLAESANSMPNGINIQNFNDGSSSPLQMLENMSLQSPTFTMPTTNVNDEFVQFSQILFDNK